MKDNKIKIITKIMMIYVLLQPFLDILSFLKIRNIISFGISTYIKPLFVFSLAIYIYIFFEKDKKKWLTYGILFVILAVGHIFILKNLLISNSIIIHECRFLLNIAYMVALFIIFNIVYKNYPDKQDLLRKLKRTVILTFLIYCLLLLVAVLTGTSALTYEYADKTKLGYKGWFDSGQILGHAISIFFPLLLYIILKPTNKWYIKIIVLFLILTTVSLLGTKVPYYIVVACLFLYVVISIFIKFLNKKHIFNLFNILLVTCSLFCMILTYKYTPVAYNTNINKYSYSTSLDEYDRNKITGKENSDYLKQELNNDINKEPKKEINEYLKWSNIAAQNLNILYEKEVIHPSNNRYKQVIYSGSIFLQSSLKYKIFGIGYLNQNDLALESDFFMALFGFGILGFILFLGLPFLLFIKETKIILKNLNKIDLETYLLYMGLGIFFCISIYAGYTYIYTNFSIFLVILIIMIIIKNYLFENENNVKINKNKISFLLLHLGFGGIETSTINSANALSDYYDVEIISFYKLKNEQINLLNDKVKIKYLYLGEPNKKELKDSIKKLDIINIIKEGFKSINILYNKKHLIKKEIINSNSFAIVSTRVEFSVLLSKYGRNNVIKIAQEHHHHNNDKRYINKLKYKYKNIDYLCALTKTLEKDYKKFLKKSNEKTKVILLPNMIGESNCNISNLNNKNIISVGRLEEGKKIDELITIFNKLNLKNSKLYIIGSGSKEKELKALVENLNITNKVEFLGYLDSKQQEEYYLKSSVFAMTSTTEGLPMVLLEAMQHGLPCIAYETDSGVNDIIKNNKNGFVIKNRNQNKYIKNLNMILSNKKLKNNMKKESLNIIEKFSKEEILKIWFKILK